MLQFLGGDEAGWNRIDTFIGLTEGKGPYFHAIAVSLIRKSFLHILVQLSCHWTQFGILRSTEIRSEAILLVEQKYFFQELPQAVGGVFIGSN